VHTPSVDRHAAAADAANQQQPQQRQHHTAMTPPSVVLTGAAASAAPPAFGATSPRRQAGGALGMSASVIVFDDDAHGATPRATPPLAPRPLSDTSEVDAAVAALGQLHPGLGRVAQLAVAAAMAARQVVADC
jgi:hypothetical protein